VDDPGRARPCSSPVEHVIATDVRDGTLFEVVFDNPGDYIAGDVAH